MKKKQRNSTIEKMPRLTVRLTPNQMLVLNELVEALNVSHSQLVRAIVLDFITHNEERLEKIIQDKNKKDE